MKQKTDKKKGPAPPAARRTTPSTGAVSSVEEIKARKKAKKSRHPWRENVEALAMAIVVALLFKSFVLEISKIPSGSMQPTLMGEPDNRVFDRVLVDKLSFSLRDPKRWEIVVFKHPLENSRIMVKRLVGMPGESLRIAGGDLWTRSSDQEEWQILRRPKGVQEEMWRRVDLKEPRRSSWSRAEGTSGWHIQGRDITARDRGKVIFRKDEKAIRDHYLDGYPDSLRNDKIRFEQVKSERNDVADLRLTGRLRASDETAFVRLELTEGTRTYAFVLPGPAGDRAAPAIEVIASSPATATAEDGRLAADDWIRFAVENLDDRLSLTLDGEEVAALEIEPHTGRGSGVSLAMEGGEVLFEDLMVERDIYYVGWRSDRSPPKATWEVAIPEGSYAMLGDNTQDSADSRDWRAQRFTWTTPEGEMSVIGNYRGDPENPTLNRELGLTRFRDEWGEEHWIARGTGGAASPEFKSPLVRRQLIQGRALAVFWPLKPHRGLWRLGWLH
jgi:signal peptidase I